MLKMCVGQQAIVEVGELNRGTGIQNDGVCENWVVIIVSKSPRRHSPHTTECIVTPLQVPGTLVDASCISKPKLPTRLRWLFRLAWHAEVGTARKRGRLELVCCKGRCAVIPSLALTRSYCTQDHLTSISGCRLLLQHELATTDEADDSHRPFELI
jgi:hypothetical protein